MAPQSRTQGPQKWRHKSHGIPLQPERQISFILHCGWYPERHSQMSVDTIWCHRDVISSDNVLWSQLWWAHKRTWLVKQWLAAIGQISNVGTSPRPSALLLHNVRNAGYGPVWRDVGDGRNYDGGWYAKWRLLNSHLKRPLSVLPALPMYVKTLTMHMGWALLLSQRCWSGWPVWERRTVDNARNSPHHNEHQASWVGHSLEQVIRGQQNIDPNPKKKMLHPFFSSINYIM